MAQDKKSEQQKPNDNKTALAEMDPRVTLYAFLAYIDHVRWVLTDDRGNHGSWTVLSPLLLGIGLAVVLPIGPWHPLSNPKKSTNFSNTTATDWKMLVVASSILFDTFQVMSHVPFIWDSEYISCLTDIFVGFGILLSMHPDVLCRTVRDQFAWFYLAAGAWKLNWHFWNSDTSCATMFFTQLIARYLSPTNVDRATQLVGMIKPWGPLKTLIIELGMGLLQVAGVWGWRECERYGAILTVLFHLAVCCVPAPNDISPFAVHCGSRLVMYASYEGAHKSLQWLNKWFRTITAIATVVIAYGMQHGWNVMNWAFAIYIFDLAIVLQALFVKDSKKIAKTRRNWWCWLGSASTFFYAFGSIALGLQEQGTPNMFVCTCI
jgi:hypothetical protein